MIVCFSATGNSAAVASVLARRLSDCVEAWPWGAPPSLSPDEVVGLVMPVHAWDVPQVVLPALQQWTSALRRTHYIYVVLTCGDDVGMADHRLSRKLASWGVKLSAVWSVQMPNTYVGLPGFDVDTPELAQQKLKRALPRLEAIARQVNARSEVCDVECGGAPRLKSGLLRALFTRFLVTDRPFHVNERCNGCGRCAKVCPVGNLVCRPQPQWQGHCIACFACYHACPQRAIQYGSATRRKGQCRRVYTDGERLSLTPIK